MAERFIYYAPVSSQSELDELTRKLGETFDLLTVFRPGGFQRAELFRLGDFPDFPKTLGLQVRRTSCQGSLDTAVNSLSTLEEVVSALPSPPYSFRLAVIGRFECVSGGEWWFNMRCNPEGSFELVVTPPKERRTAEDFEQVFRVMSLPYQVRRANEGFRLENEQGTDLRRTLVHRGSPGDFVAPLSASSWLEVIRRSRPLFLREAPLSGVAWSTTMNHETLPQSPNHGWEVYDDFRRLGLPVIESLLLLEYRLDSLERLTGLQEFVGDFERGSFRAGLCQFRVSEDDVASIDVVVTREGSYFELEVRNPEIVGLIRRAAGLRFEAEDG